MRGTTPLAILCAALLAVISAANAQAQSQRPNIVLILADDLGYETIACNGGESYRTPAIDRMAAAGMRFENVYAHPLCTPSRSRPNRAWARPASATCRVRVCSCGTCRCASGSR